MVRGLLLALLCWASMAAASQRVEHLSVNGVHFTPGERLNLTMNVVGKPMDVRQLRFFLVQNGQFIPLSLLMEGDYMMRLRSPKPAKGSRIHIVAVNLYRDDANKRLNYYIDLDPTARHPKVLTKTTGGMAIASATPPPPEPVSKAVSEPQSCALKGRTFWSMAREAAPTLGVGHYGAMMALLESNPKCFRDGNPNRLICKELSCPGSESLANWQDEAVAKTRFESAMKAAAN